MSLTKDLVRNALKTVRLSDGRDVVSADVLRWVAACDGIASMKLDALDGVDRRALAAACCKAVRLTAGAVGVEVQQLTVEFVNEQGDTVETVRDGSGGTSQPPADQATHRAASDSAPPDQASGHRPIGGLKQAGPLSGVKHVVAVGAGKGGVGKSTVSVNLAVGLARRGHAVGLMDGDIYGPSLPTMMGLDSLEQIVQQGMLEPFLVHGVKCVTIGKLVEADKPLIWRGPMAHGAFKQLAEQTNWGELDYLIVDLPPGTGDVPLTLAQSLELRGAVVVCTPQRVAQDDAVRAARMFGQLKIDVLGVVENMSHFVGDDGKEYDLFGRGGAEQMAQRLGLPFLGGVPISMGLRERGDAGDPSGNFEAEQPRDAPLRAALERMLDTFESQIALASMRQGGSAPTLSIS